MARKQSSQRVSSIAGKVLGSHRPSVAEARKLAASVLSQDEKKGR